tara:strand:+ start:1587 stop:1970 length:384 start_codon:yes stop_codon:yes gene_type:complete
MSIENQIKNFKNLKINQNDEKKFINDLKTEIKIRKKRTTKRIVFSSLFLLPIFSYLIFLSYSNDTYFISDEYSIEQKEDFNLDQHNIHFESIDYIIDNSDLIVSDCVLSCDLVKEYNACIVNFAFGI